MAVGALIGAYQESDNGELRALLPLAGRTLIEYQARCAAAAGAAPVVVVVERIPPSLNAAFERLRGEGVNLIPVSDASEAASRFEPGALILMIADGCAPDMPLVARIAGAEEPAIATVPDDEAHSEFERLDAVSRWAGVALVDGQTLGATVAMLGDWDLQSTLLRRTVQAGAIHIRVGDGPFASPLLAIRPEETANFERRFRFHPRLAVARARIADPGKPARSGRRPARDAADAAFARALAGPPGALAGGGPRADCTGLVDRSAWRRLGGDDGRAERSRFRPGGK